MQNLFNVITWAYHNMEPGMGGYFIPTNQVKHNTDLLGGCLLNVAAYTRSYTCYLLI